MVTVKKLIKEIERMLDEATKTRNKMQGTGRWLALSEFSELEGKVDALSDLLEYCLKEVD